MKMLISRNLTISFWDFPGFWSLLCTNKYIVFQTYFFPKVLLSCSLDFIYEHFNQMEISIKPWQMCCLLLIKIYAIPLKQIN